MTSISVAERRVSAAVIIAACAVFAGLLLVVTSYFQSFDEAKYLGVGVNLWAGHGPITAFGIRFLSHAPAWSAILIAPEALAGFDGLTWGRILNAIAGTAIIALTGILGWRVRPYVGAIAAAGLLALVYLHDLSRTARLDVPAAALALLYMVVGLEAVRRRSTRWAIAAGAVFALGFLVKETNLPFAPVPLLAGLLWGAPLRSLARTSGWMLGVAALGLAPWFVYYAAYERVVYRLDAPAWALLPLGLLVALLALGGIFADRLAAGPVGRLTRPIAARLGPERRSRAVVGWCLAFGWFVGLSFVFSRTARLKGAPLVDVPQLNLYAQEWFVELQAVVVFGLLGVALGIVALIVMRGSAAAAAIRDLVVATICGLPLVLLVVAVGEPPRNYLANLAILTALAAAGWAWTLESLLRIRRRWLLIAGGALLGAMTGLVLAGLAGRTSGQTTVALGAVAGAVAMGGVAVLRNGAWRPYALPAVAIVALIGGSGVLAVHVRATSNPPGGVARAAAIRTVTDWIETNVPRGSTIAFGSFLSYEMAYPLANDYHTVQVRHRISISDAEAPDGFLRVHEEPAGDWIAADIAPRNVNEFQAYRATWLLQQLPKVNYWVYTTGISTSAPTIEAALRSATGLERVAEWTFPVADNPPLHTSIYRIDGQRLAFDRSRLAIAPEALDRLVTLLTGAPGGQAAAQRLVGQVDIEPAGPEADAAMARLKALAGGG